MPTLSNDEFVNQFLNTLSSGPEGPPLTAIVLDDGSVAVFWQDDAVADGAIRHRMYDLEGNPLQDDLVITAPTSAGPDNVVIAAVPPGGFVVLWQDDTGVAYQNFDVNGAFESSIDENGNSTGVVWSDLQADIYYGWTLSVEGSSVSVKGSEDARVYVWNSDYLNRTFGTSGNEAMTGTVGEDMLAGLGGNDSISGADGEDDLFGGSGNDVLNGGSGEDMLSGGTGNDTFVTDGSDAISENAGGGTDTVQSSGSMTLGANLENLVLSGTGAINGAGNGGANSLTGNGSANVLVGGGGTDNLAGGGGNDTYITDGGDKITEVSGAGTDTVQSSVRLTLGANLENLTLTGSSAINGTGNTLANTITGNSGNNVLNGGGGSDSMGGGGGNDTLNAGEGNDRAFGGTGNDNVNGGSGDDVIDGGRGNDIMTGNEGADRFVFVSGRDVITDFEGGDDDLDLSALLSVNSFSQAMARATQQGDDVVLNFAEGRLTLQDVSRSSLDSDDFIF
jgi:Ca2+-binding RTX toxin-like protein